jgi:hypothetical protein
MKATDVVIPSQERGISAQRDGEIPRSARDDSNPRWPRWLRRGPMELAASLLIGAGVLMLLQPFALSIYTYSFITTLAGTVMFIVVSKFPD